MLAAVVGCHGLEDVGLAESLAIRIGLQLSKEAGVWSILVETDSLIVINLIKKKVSIDSEIGLLLSYIRTLYPDVDNNIVHANRFCNKRLMKWPNRLFLGLVARSGWKMLHLGWKS